MLGAGTALLEGGSRAHLQRRFSAHATDLHVQGNARWQDDPAAGWRNRARYLEYDGSSQYSDTGARVRPGQVALPPRSAGDLWIVLLGGSAMAGVGSAQTGEWLRMTGIGVHPIEDAIDGQLEALLQARLPGRTVRVFNHAVAWYTLTQCRALYRERLAVLRPDFVVALNGANEPSSLAPAETTGDVVRERWRTHPMNRFPIREARWLMSRSALAYAAGEFVFFRSGLVRTTRRTPREEAVVQRWMGEPRTARVAPPTAGESRAVAEFFATARAFRHDLAAAGTPHLLLVQPELSLRRVERLGVPERALYNYYLAERGGVQHTFMRRLHEAVEAEAGGGVLSLASLHDEEGWLLLDNCHLTREANRRIATRVADHICRSLAGCTPGPANIAVP